MSDETLVRGRTGWLFAVLVFVMAGCSSKDDSKPWVVNDETDVATESRDVGTDDSNNSPECEDGDRGSDECVNSCVTNFATSTICEGGQWRCPGIDYSEFGQEGPWFRRADCEDEGCFGGPLVKFATRAGSVAPLSPN